MDLGDKAMHRLSCSEIWGGNREIDADICAGPLMASVFSRGVNGGRGGDIYYFSVCGRNNVARIALADVVGHGQAVSQTGQWLYDAMSLRMNEMVGRAILGDLNKLAKARGRRLITTAEVITFDKGDFKLHFAYAGHPPLLIKRQDQPGWRIVSLKTPSPTGDIPLGILENVQYDEEFIHLKSGDALFLYTDGVIEAVGKDGQRFGVKRLLEVLGNQPINQPIGLKQAVLDELIRFTDGNFQHDDMTLMAIRIS
ncbi:MAG: serine/threonine-protein phosphatase [Nitrospinae bacterium]|nr:serine/threonine-protein phosphatase [Nitrospinota bacterium]